MAPYKCFLFWGGGRGASLVAQMVKNLPAMGETRVQSLDREDPLEEEMATHSSILAWRTPWIEEPGGLQSTYKCFYYFAIMLAYFVLPMKF